MLPVDDETTWAYARLRHRCCALGHPLHQKQHVGDLWIAATAIRWQLPLVAHDAVFLDCRDLDLLTELPHNWARRPDPKDQDQEDGTQLHPDGRPPR